MSPVPERPLLSNGQYSSSYHLGCLWSPNTQSFSSSVCASSPANPAGSLCLPLLSWSCACSILALGTVGDVRVQSLWLLQNAITIDQEDVELCALSLAFHASIIICQIH